jgi:sulfonate transport system substrate-binding protein
VIRVLLALLLVLVGCTRADRTSDVPSNQGAAAEVRLGYFPNITHIGALVGVERGLFTEELGATKFTPVTFNDGSAEISALLGGSLDIAFVGSGPAINAFAKSDGEAVRLVAGATSGGAQLVVRPDIELPQQLIGRTVATPGLANTQDVAFKKWPADSHLSGAVNVTNVESARALDAFTQGQIDGAWLPEPWSSRLVLEAGAKVLVDEQTRWPDGRFPTTVVVARTDFLHAHPQTVRSVLKGLVRAERLTVDRPVDAKTAANAQLRKLTGRDLSSAVLDRAFTAIVPTTDPQEAAFRQLAQDAVTAGVSTKPVDLTGFAELDLLTAVLAEPGTADHPQGNP